MDKVNLNFTIKIFDTKINPRLYLTHTDPLLSEFPTHFRLDNCCLDKAVIIMIWCFCSNIVHILMDSGFYFYQKISNPSIFQKLMNKFCRFLTFFYFFSG